SSCYCSAFLYPACRLSRLHSFPTRRSSDLEPLLRRGPAAVVGLRARHHAVHHRVDHHEPAPGGDPAVGGPLQGGPERSSQDHAVDRKSTRLNSSHVKISYAVFCLKKKMSRA